MTPGPRTSSSALGNEEPHGKGRVDEDVRGPRKRLIVGVSGASGFDYGVRILEMLKAAGIETHLVVSRAAMTAMAPPCPHECRCSPSYAAVT